MSGNTTGKKRVAWRLKLSRLWINLVIVAALASTTGVAEAQRPESVCSYKGKYNVKFDFVRDICPPPQNNGMHYLVLDIDPGLSSQVVMHAYTVSPENAVCAKGICTSGIASGYDIFVSDTCLPTRENRGLTLTNGMVPNDLNTTLKPIVLKMITRGKLYIGLAQKEWIPNDSLSCSIRFVPGALESESFASGSSCFISDYDGETGIFPCTTVSKATEGLDLPPWVLGATGAAGGAVGLILAGIMFWIDRKRKRRAAIQAAEDQFRQDMLARGSRKDKQIRMAAIDVSAAEQGYKHSRVVPWRDSVGGVPGGQEEEEEGSSMPGTGWGKQSSN